MKIEIDEREIGPAERLDLFEKELSHIEFEDIKDFTIKCLLMAPEYFFVIPSSLTGKHHPSDENEKGGCVKHTKRVVKLSKELVDLYGIDFTESDILISSAILHDTLKCGLPPIDEYHTVRIHPYLPAWYYEKYKEFKYYNDIMSLIGNHMGIFSPFEISIKDRLKKVQEILIVADYISSKRYVSVEI